MPASVEIGIEADVAPHEDASARSAAIEIPATSSSYQRAVIRSSSSEPATRRGIGSLRAAKASNTAVALRPAMRTSRGRTASTRIEQVVVEGDPHEAGRDVDHEVAVALPPLVVDLQEAGHVLGVSQRQVRAVGAVRAA